MNNKGSTGKIADMDIEFLTVDQAAAKLQMHPRTIRRLLARGELPGQKIGVRQWRVSATALSAFVEGGRKQPVDLSRNGDQE